MLTKEQYEYLLLIDMSVLDESRKEKVREKCKEYENFQENAEILNKVDEILENSY